MVMDQLYLEQCNIMGVATTSSVRPPTKATDDVVKAANLVELLDREMMDKARFDLSLL